MSENLSESMENYLETILYLENNHKVARVKDIADRLGLQRGSVTGALKVLKQKGLIDYAPYTFITLTRTGKKIAKDVAYRHQVLKNFLLDVLQLDSETAESNACRMEHAIDAKTLERLVCFIEYIHTCPRTGSSWLSSFVDFCQSENREDRPCEACLQRMHKEEIRQ